MKEKNNIALKFFIISLILFIGYLCFSSKSLAHSYPSDYRKWNQSQSDYPEMREYGCFVTAQAKLIYASGIDQSPYVNPDSYFNWEKACGYISNDGISQANNIQPPITYASQVGINLQFVEQAYPTDDKLWSNIYAGYHTIVEVYNNNGQTHFIYVDNDVSKYLGKIYIDDGGGERALNDYNSRITSYSYRLQPAAPTAVQDLGNSFYAYLTMAENGLYNVDRNSDIVLEKDSTDLNSIWKFFRQDDGTYVIQNVGSGLFMDIMNSNNYNGGRIWTFSFNGSSAQKFYVYGNPNGYVLRPQCLGNRVVTVNNGGNFIGNKLNVYVYYDNCPTQTFKIIKTELPKENNTGLPFVDVSKNAWYFDAVKFTYENEMITGKDKTHFAPKDKLTRGEIVTILWRMEGSPDNMGNTKFTDVASTPWYARAVKWAVDNGIVNGYKGTTKFGPKDNVTRQDLAVILRNYAKYKGKNINTNASLTKFKDYKKISSYAKESMQWAVGTGVISGNGNGTLDPKGNANRAEAAAMIQKYCNKVGK